ncbi:uncharacterized protein MKZ38_003740 [Zalerion maritima]|uniref:WD repeat-containing protein n=1 Tax=Zalerion maritima TaxID=339359 RepID=A0AAD5RYC0_9PEZI|nr:uncharacterized protein MKZ38_003740 [Zalerion maritima]
MSDSDDFQVEVPQLAKDDPLRSFIPGSFGQMPKEVDIAAQLGRARRPAAIKPEKPQQQAKSAEDSDSNLDSGSDSDDDGDEFPVSHEMVLKTHERAVTTVSLDPAGTRLISGSLDGTLKLHDLPSLTPTTLRAFKTVDPYQGKPSANSEQFPICHIEFSPLSGGAVLCVGDHPQPKILSRDGDILTEFVKGDMYLRDQNNTKGHTAAATTGSWHPSDRNICVTAGTDSTLRIWDINNKRSQKDILVFKSKVAGNAGRTRMTAVVWASPAHGGNNVLVAAALDGSLVMWSGNGPFSRPTAEIRDAHKAGTWTGGLDVSKDGRMVVTRGGDGLVKLWDMRNFKKPLVAREHPSSADQYPMNTIKYSPNSTNILTGSPTGDLCILNPGNLTPELVTPVTPGFATIAIEWHPKINQIITASANAETRMLFSPEKSSRGALEVMSKAPKKRHVDDDPALTTDQTYGISGDSIIVPGSGGHVSSRRNAGVSQAGRSKDPRRPHAPQQTPFQRSQPNEKHISENIPLSKMLHEDPREALLKYADVAKKDPQFTGAWKSTQPVTQYADISDEEDDQPQKKKTKR